MCRYEPEIQDEEEEVQEFKLAERMTFLEYIPVASTIRKSFSSPDFSTPDGPHSETQMPCIEKSQKSQRPPWSRQESAASTACSSGWSRQLSGTSTCWTLNEAGEPPESVDSDEGRPDFVDLEISEVSNGSVSGAGQWSVGAARHAQGDCKPCAWFWRPGGCTRGEVCQHCHLCPRGALQKKKRQNRQVLRAAARAKAKALTVAQHGTMIEADSPFVHV